MDRAAEDRIELRALIDTYGVLVDQREFDRVAGLFVPDGLLTTSVGPPAVGRRAIATSLESALAWFADRHGLVGKLVTQHLMANHVCELRGVTATGVVYATARLGGPGGASPRAVINVLRYEDRYERVGAQWRLRSRGIVRLWSEEARLTG